jgi:hypothetical protein
VEDATRFDCGSGSERAARLGEAEAARKMARISNDYGGIMRAHPERFACPAACQCRMWKARCARSNTRSTCSMQTGIGFMTSYEYLTIGQNLDGVRKLVSLAQLAAITRDNAVRLLPRLEG